MKCKYLNTFFAVLMTSVSGLTNAGVIDSSSVLLDDSSASQLENWLGQGDLNWNSIWYGETGVASTDWHNAVDGVSNTVSIYNVTHLSQNYLIGGYNANAWSSTRGWEHDFDGTWDNFIFNLTTNVKAQTLDPHQNFSVGQYATYNHPDYFATFGGGFDLTSNATGVLGSGTGYAVHYGTYVGEINSSQGNIVTGVKGVAQFQVNSLETFTFSSATAVPEPSTLAIFTLGIIGLAVRRFKK